MREHLYHYDAVVTNIVDGDTVDMEISLGFSLTIKERIRLAGIDAPEVRGEEREKGLEKRIWLLLFSSPSSNYPL